MVVLADLIPDTRCRHEGHTEAHSVDHSIQHWSSVDSHILPEDPLDPLGTVDLPLQGVKEHRDGIPAQSLDGLYQTVDIVKIAVHPLFLIEEDTYVGFIRIQSGDVIAECKGFLSRIIHALGDRTFRRIDLEIQTVESVQCPLEERYEIIISPQYRVSHHKVVLFIRSQEKVPEGFGDAVVGTAQVHAYMMHFQGIPDLIELLAVGRIPVDLYRDEISSGDELYCLGKEKGILVQVGVVEVTVVYVITHFTDFLDSLVHQEAVHRPYGDIDVPHPNHLSV